jgi:hypothetical protein
LDVQAGHQHAVAAGIAGVVIVGVAFFGPMLDGETLSNVPSVMQRFARWAHGGNAPFYIQSDQATSTYRCGQYVFAAVTKG